MKSVKFLKLVIIVLSYTGLSWAAQENQGVNISLEDINNNIANLGRLAKQLDADQNTLSAIYLEHLNYDPKSSLGSILEALTVHTSAMNTAANRATGNKISHDVGIAGIDNPAEHSSGFRVYVRENFKKTIDNINKVKEALLALKVPFGQLALKVPFGQAQLKQAILLLSDNISRLVQKNLRNYNQALSQNPVPPMSIKPLPGEASLHWAARVGDLDKVKFFLSKGGDITAVGNSTESALDVAKQEKHNNIVQYLSDELAKRKQEAGAALGQKTNLPNAVTGIVKDYL